MKKQTILVLIALLMGGYAQAQGGNALWGVKLGLNYSGNGSFVNSVSEFELESEDGDRSVGFHAGVFGKLGDKIFVRPELVFTRTGSDYSEGDLKINKLDLPVLAGFKVIGPLNVFAGPSFQYLISGKLGDVELDNLESDITVGLNLGVSVDISNIGLEVRYERGFSENEANFINSNIVTLADDTVDTRPDQLILSLSIKL